MAFSNDVIDEVYSLARRISKDTECCERTLSTALGLTPTQASTLDVLGSLGEATMNRLSDGMGLHGTTMTRMVDGLVKVGFVERFSDPADRRVVKVRLSPSGQAAMEEYRTRRRASLSEVLQGSAESRHDGLLDSLRQVSFLIEQWGAFCCGRRPSPRRAEG